MVYFIRGGYRGEKGRYFSERSSKYNLELSLEFYTYFEYFFNFVCLKESFFFDLKLFKVF